MSIVFNFIFTSDLVSPMGYTIVKKGEILNIRDILKLPQIGYFWGYDLSDIIEVYT